MYIHTEAYTQMLEQHYSQLSKREESTPTYEWINKVWCIHTTEYYLAI